MKIGPIPKIDQENSFWNSFNDERINSTRIVMILGMLLFTVHCVYDYLGLSIEKFAIIFPVRVVGIFALFVIFCLTCKPIFLKHYNKILLSGHYIAGAIISFGIYLSDPGEYIYDTYFAVLILHFITFFSWSYVQIRKSILMSIVFIAVYTVIKLFVHNTTQGIELLIFTSHLVFLSSVVVIASMGQYLRDSLIYRNMELQNNLKEIADEKIIEAKKQEQLANIDVLTGIPNRRYITEKLRKSLTKIERSGKHLTLLFIDLNNFKSINDDYGHDSGDKVLEITTKRLQKTIRESDLIARLGGDEFLIGLITTHLSDSFIEDVIQKIKTSVAEPIAFNGNLLNVGLSIGSACYPTDGRTVEELIKFADANMYEDKNANEHQITTLTY